MDGAQHDRDRVARGEDPNDETGDNHRYRGSITYPHTGHRASTFSSTDAGEGVHVVTRYTFSPRSSQHHLHVIGWRVVMRRSTPSTVWGAFPNPAQPSQP